MYKIKLADGTIIDNLELNGNNYITNDLNKDVFVNNLEEVVITDKDGNVTTLYNQKVQFAKIGAQETFILSEKTIGEIEKEQLKEENASMANAITELTVLMSMVFEGGV